MSTDNQNTSKRSLYAEVKEKVSQGTARDPYLTGIDSLVLSDKKRHNVPQIVQRNRRKELSKLNRDLLDPSYNSARR